MHNLFKNVSASRIRPDGVNWELVAGTGDSPTSDVIDTQNTQGVAIETVFGAILATGTVAQKVQYSKDGVTNWTDVPGASIAVVAANSLQVGVIEIYKPTARYLRVISARATANVVVDAMLVKKYALAHRAPTGDATYPLYAAVNNP